MLNHLSQTQIETIAVWYVVQHSLSSYYKIKAHFKNLEDSLKPESLIAWKNLNLHKNHIQRLEKFHTQEGQTEFQHLLQHIKQSSDFVITEADSCYPTQLLPYSDRPPIIFGQGNEQILLQPQIAIVGSRKSSPHGRQVAYDFAYYLSEKGFYINSGLAQGIDEAAHQGGIKNHRTIAVMGTGLDITYPSQNQALRQEIINHHGAVITEFLPTTKPLQQHFPRRNRIVSGLSLGIIVAEASLESGSLITAKLAADQGKLIFAIPGHIYSEHHQGCHQLIREGAILIDHPEQAIEDLALPTQWHSQQNSEQNNSTELSEKDSNQFLDIPDYLIPLYKQLDWVGQNIDQLATTLQLDIATLTGHLMELELSGLCMQQSGLYVRCRSNK
ncbi:DNA processing protein DprA [Acinetobacter sp. Ac_877]|uniref:DNA-processing protein DprA n=1 Tax=Acinetobacter portensis TaxID=1839785 RepID=UPI00128E6C87|nr:DNA-processing protein DprA [Acinetobacter portensis]MPW42785.1 DNA processing protein DprA [Acinetobacter portensis]